MTDFLDIFLNFAMNMPEVPFFFDNRMVPGTRVKDRFVVGAEECSTSMERSDVEHSDCDIVSSFFILLIL